MRKGSAITFLILGLIVGPVVTIYGVIEYRNSLKLVAGGKRVVAKVTDRYREWFRTRNTGYRIKVEFRDPSGTTNYQTTLKVSRTKYLDAAGVPVLDVVYLPSDPTIAQMGATASKDNTTLLTGGILIVVGIAGFVWKRLQPS